LHDTISSLSLAPTSKDSESEDSDAESTVPKKQFKLSAIFQQEASLS